MKLDKERYKANFKFDNGIHQLRELAKLFPMLNVAERHTRTQERKSMSAFIMIKHSMIKLGQEENKRRNIQQFCSFIMNLNIDQLLSHCL